MLTILCISLIIIVFILMGYFTSQYFTSSRVRPVMSQESSISKSRDNEEELFHGDVNRNENTFSYQCKTDQMAHIFDAFPIYEYFLDK